MFQTSIYTKVPAQSVDREPLSLKLVPRTTRDEFINGVKKIEDFALCNGFEHIFSRTIHSSVLVLSFSRACVPKNHNRTLLNRVRETLWKRKYVPF